VEEKHKLAITAVIIVVILGLFGYLVYTTKTEIDRTSEEIGKINADIQNVKRTKVDQIPTLEAVKAENREFWEETLLEVVPEYNVMAAHDGSIDKMMTETGFEVTEYSPLKLVVARGGRRGKQRQTEPLQRYNFDVEGNGSFFSLVRFINLFEKEPRFYSVDSFKIDHAQRRGSDLIKATVKFSVYTYSTPDNVSATTR